MTDRFQIVDRHIEFTSDLGSGDRTLSLPFVDISDGLWHTVFVERHGSQVILKMDGGEGRYYNESLPNDDFPLLLLDGEYVFGGAAVNYPRFHPDPQVNRVFESSEIFLSDSGSQAKSS